MIASMIIPTIGGHDYIFDAIASIEKNTHVSYEIILVYNGPINRATEFAQAIKERFPRVKIIVSDEEYRIAHAYNLGTEAAEGKYIALFHDDTMVLEDSWLTKIIRQMEADPRIGVIGPQGKM